MGLLIIMGLFAWGVGFWSGHEHGYYEGERRGFTQGRLRG